MSAGEVGRSAGDVGRRSVTGMSTWKPPNSSSPRRGVAAAEPNVGDRPRVGESPPELRSVVLDVDWVWRRLLPQAWSGVAEVWMIGQRALLSGADRLLRSSLDVMSAYLSPWSRLGEPWPTGVTAMWAAALLLAYLFLSY